MLKQRTDREVRRERPVLGGVQNSQSTSHLAYSGHYCRFMNKNIGRSTDIGHR